MAKRLLPVAKKRKGPVPKAKGKAASRAPSRMPGTRRFHGDESSHSVEEAEGLLPAGARLWKDTLCSRWMVVYFPFGNLSRSWRLHGDTGALWQVCAWAWWQHSEAGLGQCEVPLLEGVEWRQGKQKAGALCGEVV